MRAGQNKRGEALIAKRRNLCSVRHPAISSQCDALDGKRRELESLFLIAGGPPAIDYLHQSLTVAEAAQFLNTTKGQLYNLLYRRAVPFLTWGKRGKRFCRIDLIAWQEMQRVSPH